MTTEFAVAVLRDHWMAVARKFATSGDPVLAAEGRMMLGLLPAFFAWIDHERTERADQLKADVCATGSVLGLMLAILGGIASNNQGAWLEKMTQLIHANARGFHNECAIAIQAAQDAH